ncbi:MAG: hypothetical protein AVDCRST_MAG78-1237, partial [uncultured Rubrobacteraceae bacterium]
GRLLHLREFGEPLARGAQPLPDRAALRERWPGPRRRKEAKPAFQRVASARTRDARSDRGDCLGAFGAPGLRGRPGPPLGDRTPPVHRLRCDGPLRRPNGMALAFLEARLGPRREPGVSGADPAGAGGSRRHGLSRREPRHRVGHRGQGHHPL